MATTPAREQHALETLRRQDRPLDWGAERDMNALEALMWRAEEDPHLRSTVCGLEEFDSTPDWDRFLAAHEWGTRLVPRFRQHVVEPALGLGRPCWAVDPDFDLHYHVRRVRLPDGAGFRELLAAAEQAAMAPLDRARALWEATLFEGLPDGRAAYLLKLHHSTADGIGFVQMLGELHSRTRTSNPDKPQPLPPRPETVTPTDALIRQLGEDARALPGAVAHAAQRGLQALARPDRTTAEALRFGGSLRRVLADPDAEGSPLLRGRSLSWRFQAFDVEFAPLRAASKAAGGSLNDAFLAGLLGAFRRYHEELGAPIERMPIAIPISVRRAEDLEGGNRFAGARLAAPVGVADPAARIQAIGGLMRDARGEPAIDGLGLVAPALARLPAPAISLLAGELTKSNDLQASNVPGLREERFFAGARIERSYPFGPLPGCATMVTLLSHGDMCCIGVNLDPAAVTEPERFADCMLGGFDEVLALAPGAASLTRRT
jgi:diacylglycerol O-acyltransferase / wax synthase